MEWAHGLGRGERRRLYQPPLLSISIGHTGHRLNATGMHEQRGLTQTKVWDKAGIGLHLLDKASTRPRLWVGCF